MSFISLLLVCQLGLSMLLISLISSGMHSILVYNKGFISLAGELFATIFLIGLCVLSIIMIVCIDDTDVSRNIKSHNFIVFMINIMCLFLCYVAINIAFINISKYGNINLATKIYNIFSINKHAVKDAFVAACVNGKLNVAQWIYNLENINIDANTQNEVYKQCTNSYVLVWLYELGNISIASHNSVFRQAYECNNIELVRVLYNMNNINIETQNQVFENNSLYKNYDVIEWLYHLRNINIETQNKVFKQACMSGDIRLAKFLYGNGNINITTQNDLFTLCFNNTNLDIVKWLHGLGNINKNTLNSVNNYTGRYNSNYYYNNRDNETINDWLKSIIV